MTWPTPPVAETNRHIVRLERGLYDISTHVRLDDRDLGTGDAAFAALEAEMKKLTVRVGSTPGGAAANPETELAGTINVDPLVPHPEVIRAIDAFVKAGITDITFDGAPPPGLSRRTRHVLVLRRDEDETTTHVRLDDRDLGTGDAAFNALAVALKGSKLKSGKIDAYGLTPIADLRRAIAALRSVGISDVEWTAEYLKAGPRPKIHLCLQLVDRKAQLSILAERISSGVMRVQSDPDKALLALDAMIRKLVTAGLEPVGLVDASRYMDQKIVDRILDLFKKHGIDDVLIIR